MTVSSAPRIAPASSRRIVGVLAPLVKWGDPDSGLIPGRSIRPRTFEVEAAIVNMPPSNARLGLMAWTSLSHEAAGHDILHADEGLRGGMQAQGVRRPAQRADRRGLDEYWSERIDETASDVLGILNMGPAAGIGLIGFFRGWNATEGAARLSNVGDARRSCTRPTSCAVSSRPRPCGC